MRRTFLGCGLVAAVIAFAPAVEGATELYKWVDEDGTVTYSQLKPPRERAAQPVELRGFGPPHTEPEVSEAELLEQTKLKEEEEKARVAAAQAETERVEREKTYCDLAQKNLRVLQSPAQRLSVQGADGKSHYMDDKERAAKITETQTQIEEFCG